ncbi:MAG: hypothetical protein ABI828_00220 [Actinomycetota bacterium]
MGDAKKDMVDDANDAQVAKAESRPGDDHAYEDSWYQVLRARQEAADDADGTVADVTEPASVEDATHN